IIMECLTTVSMQIQWDRKPSAEFFPSKGIRQVYPMSPYIFVLCMEKLRKLIHNSVDNKAWKLIVL
ncbi:hypothetical protein J1N35_041746, partial [Gossypium stocksii]